MADKPFPKTEPDINAFLQNLAAKLATYQVALSLTAADVTMVTEGAANFQYLLNATTQVSDTKEAFTNFKNSMFYGDAKAQPPEPVFPIITMPNTGPQGIVTAVKALLKRIKAAPGYTEQIGEDLGLVIPDAEALNPAEIIPELKVRAIEDGAVEIKFSKSGLDAIRLDWKLKDATEWSLAGVYTTSPAIHNGAVGGNPQAREYRGRLLKKNEAVSQYSTIYSVVTTP